MSHAVKHFLTVTRHRHCVLRHCARVGILRQGLFHDLSKYSLSEFIPGARYYQGTRSPNECERETVGYSGAWMHHKGRNRHHFEYWNDVNPATGRYEPVKMPIRFVKEMFCDRIAASKIYKGKAYTDDAALAYFLKGNARQSMHPATADLLEDWLRRVAESGEDAAFSHIRAIDCHADYTEGANILPPARLRR